MTKREEFASHIENMACDILEPIQGIEADTRKAGDLYDDRKIKWFDGIACKGATIDVSFLLKDLQRFVVDGRLFSQYVHEQPVGTNLKVSFDHVENEFTYKVMFLAYKEREESRQYPAILYFTYVKLEKATR